jgi:hypothetical protein
LVDNPIFLSIYNTIVQSWEIVISWDLSSDITLHNASKEISDLNIESIFNKDRNQVQTLLLIGTIIRNGFHQINITDEIWYGSATTESTFTAPTDNIKRLQLNFNNNVLNNVMMGKWEAPRSANDYISAWENFKLD